MRTHSFAPSALFLLFLCCSVLGQQPANEDRIENSLTPLGSNSYRFDWVGREGWTFIPQFSTNLADWFYMPEIDHGLYHDPINVTPLDQNGDPRIKFFMRLKTSDVPTLDPKNADFDGDGQSNWSELSILGTDPFKSDTSGDGLLDGQTDADSDSLPDQLELAIIDALGDGLVEDLELTSLTIEDILPGDDADDDGLTNEQEYLLGFNPYQIDSDGDGYSDRLSHLLELHLGLDESSSVVAYDSSGNGCHGTLLGSASWLPTSGSINGALDLHGSGDLVQLAPESLEGHGDATISIWFKTSASPASQTILSAANSSSSPELAISLEAGTTVRFTYGPGAFASWNSARSLADGLWHHLAICRDQSAGLATLFLDGAQLGVSQSITANTLGVESLVLGQLHDTVATFDPSNAFVGSLDDIRIYSCSLDAELLGELFRANDLDGDLLPDGWEDALYGNLFTLTHGGDDLDEDGLTNRAEYDGGTDPGDYYNGTNPVITLVSGSGQTIYNGQRTKEPLVFQVTDGTSPLVNAPVELSHPPVELSQLERIGSIATLDGNDLATSLTLRTDTEGKVSVHFKAD